MDANRDCPSFINLRHFAADAAITVERDPAGFGRKTLPLRGGPVEVGSLHFDAGYGSAKGSKGDMFLILASGCITLSSGGATLPLIEGQTVVLPCGADFSWAADRPAVAIYMRYIADGASASTDKRMVQIDAGVALTPSGAPLAELLIGATPSCRNHTTYLSDDGEFMAGVWDSTPYHRRAMQYRHFELMYLLKGSVTFIDELGHEGVFRSGDIFLVEQNAQCSWESREDVAKIYAIYRPYA